MTALLEKALAKVEGLSAEMQDCVATQILDSLADEDGWAQRFATFNPALQRMADEALAEDRRGATVPLDKVIDSL